MIVLTALLTLLLLPPQAAGADDAPAPPEEYLVCQCCCPQPHDDAQVECLYRSKGESLSGIMDKDMAWHRTAASLCKARECTPPLLYRYCDSPSASAPAP